MIPTLKYDSKSYSCKPMPNELHEDSKKQSQTLWAPRRNAKVWRKHLLTSLRRFESTCNYKHIVGDEERFVVVTLEIIFHIIEGFISIDDGDTKSYQQLKDHLINRYHPLQNCHLDFITIQTLNSDWFPLKRRLKQLADAIKMDLQSTSCMYNSDLGVEISWSLG